MAVRVLGEALTFARQHRLARYEANILGELAVSTAHLGDVGAARAMCDEVRAALDVEEDQEFVGATSGALGEVWATLGNDEEAEQAFRKALRGRLADRAYRGLVGLAEVKVRAGAWGDAGVLLGALLSWPSVMHFVRERARTALGRLQEAHDPHAVEGALSEGRATTFEELVARWVL